MEGQACHRHVISMGWPGLARVGMIRACMGHYQVGDENLAAERRRGSQPQPLCVTCMQIQPELQTWALPGLQLQWQRSPAGA
jgi:hypothetical protein